MKEEEEEVGDKSWVILYVCVKEGEVKGESRVLWASEETLIISCEVRNAGRVLNRSIVRLWWVWA